MKKMLDSNELRDALKFCSNMLEELKTSRLSPRNYFNLCKYRFRVTFMACFFLIILFVLDMLVFDELALLESHFIEEQRKGRKMADLYEVV
jgi:hypothetical protein